MPGAFCSVFDIVLLNNQCSYNFFTQILKLYAWEESFLSNINSKRAKELRYLLLSGLLRAVLTLIFNTLPVMVGIREF